VYEVDANSRDRQGLALPVRHIAGLAERNLVFQGRTIPILVRERLIKPRASRS